MRAIRATWAVGLVAGVGGWLAGPAVAASGLGVVAAGATLAGLALRLRGRGAAARRDGGHSAPASG